MIHLMFASVDSVLCLVGDYNIRLCDCFVNFGRVAVLANSASICEKLKLHAIHCIVY